MARKPKDDAPAVPVPTFTLRADDPAHREMLAALSRIALGHRGHRARRTLGVGAFTIPASVVREFELYKEAHRGE